MRKRQIELTAPSHWASYLINGDSSGMLEGEKEACDAWLVAEGIVDVLDCYDGGFRRWHDASRYALACDCQVYVVTVS
jgi:hypothetical protein